MEQKSYKTLKSGFRPDFSMEIVNALLKGPIHVRGVARLLGTNQMAISRKMKELLEGNVVDYREEGRNKVYFLKRTSEARTHAFMAESYKLLKAVNEHPTLRKIVERIQEDRKIGMAIIFGSYAKGIPKKDSDIDLYIEGSDARLKKEIEGLDSRLSVKTGPYDRDNLLIKEIEKNHIIIKGIEEYYGKSGLLERPD